MTADPTDPTPSAEPSQAEFREGRCRDRPQLRFARTVALVVVLVVLGSSGLAACAEDTGSDLAAAPTTSTVAAPTTAATPATSPAAVAALLDLLGRRLELGVEVARTKWNTKAPIEDLARESVALDAIAAAATDAGVDPVAARRLLQAQIDGGKVLQRALHEQWTTQNQPPFVTTQDLATQLRPQLDEVTTQLVARLHDLGGLPALRSEDRVTAEAAIVSRLAGTPRAADAARIALEPLHTG